MAHRCDKRCYDTCVWDPEYLEDLFQKRLDNIKRKNIVVGSRIKYNAWPERYDDRFAIVLQIKKNGNLKVQFEDDSSISGRAPYDCWLANNKKEKPKEKYLSPFSGEWV